MPTTRRVSDQGAFDTHPQFNVFDASCPSRATFGDVTGRWGALILAALAVRPLRFGGLRRAIGGISEKMLSQTLQSLDSDGLVRRVERDDQPPYIEYALTESGALVAARVDELILAVYEAMPANSHAVSSNAAAADCEG